MLVAAVAQFANGGTGFALSGHTKSVPAERLERASSKVVTVKANEVLHDAQIVFPSRRLKKPTQRLVTVSSQILM